MGPSFFFDVIRDGLRKEVDPDECCRHGVDWGGLGCLYCEELDKRRSAVLSIIVATVVAVGLVGVLIWLPGIP
jgi:hypothetical protein